jgi:hypothetical protein
MEIRQLKYFLKVAETLNFSEASRRLYISQSTLSQQISNLENEVGLPLFERNSHEVHLTEPGRELLPYAQRAVVAADSCFDHMADLKQMLTGELNIGVTYSFSAIMMDTMVDFIKIHPGVKLNIFYQSMEELMDMLKRREVDFVLAFLPLKFNKDIDSRVIFSNRLAAVMKSDHVLAKQQSVRPEELQNHGLVLPAHGLLARRAFDKFLAEKDLNLKVKVEVNNVDLIFQLLHRTNYVSILAESTVLHHENELKAIPIDMPDNQIEGCIHMLKDAYLKNAAQEFIKMLCGSTSILTNFALKDILL